MECINKSYNQNSDKEPDSLSYDSTASNMTKDYTEAENDLSRWESEEESKELC